MNKQHYLKYLKWEATPPQLRQPKTLSEFSKEHKLHPEDILEFQSSASFTEDLSNTTIQVAGTQLPKIVHALISKLERDPKSGDLQSLLKIIKDHSSSGGISEFDFTSQLSNEQLRDIKEQIELILG